MIIAKHSYRPAKSLISLLCRVKATSLYLSYTSGTPISIIPIKPLFLYFEWFINDPKLPDYNGGITNEQQAENS